MRCSISSSGTIMAIPDLTVVVCSLPPRCRMWVEWLSLCKHAAWQVVQVSRYWPSSSPSARVCIWHALLQVERLEEERLRHVSIVIVLTGTVCCTPSAIVFYLHLCWPYACMPHAQEAGLMAFQDWKWSGDPTKEVNTGMLASVPWMSPLSGPMTIHGTQHPQITICIDAQEGDTV